MSYFSGSMVDLTATATMEKMAHEGRILAMNNAGTATTFTLPPATGSGDVYHFVVKAVNTSNYVIAVDSSSATIDGCIIGCADSGNSVNGWEADSTDDTITLNGSTKGGVTIGDWVELIDIATNQWAVRGQITQSGSEATPFSAAVS